MKFISTTTAIIASTAFFAFSSPNANIYVAAAGTPTTSIPPSIASALSANGIPTTGIPSNLPPGAAATVSSVLNNISNGVTSIPTGLPSQASAAISSALASGGINSFISNTAALSSLISQYSSQVGSFLPTNTQSSGSAAATSVSNNSSPNPSSSSNDAQSLSQSGNGKVFVGGVFAILGYFLF
ncbi:6167_t:CDS:2 [Ambispora leptoticha]|uniref:6167_t:CDS:1 n=1 Tax=Ambispora leptoticha TaxID=144679 RepID=A0A9N8YQ68_9GLOM|nr:6167_t:CDS:2 [Ambispora leptoticha]